MPYLGPTSDLDSNKLEYAEKRILKVLEGEDPTIAANAAFFVALALFKMGGATREQVEGLFPPILDAFAFPRSQ